MNIIMGHPDLVLWLGKVGTNEISWHWLGDLARPPTCKVDDIYSVTSLLDH